VLAGALPVTRPDAVHSQFHNNKVVSHDAQNGFKVEGQRGCGYWYKTINSFSGLKENGMKVVLSAVIGIICVHCMLYALQFPLLTYPWWYGDEFGMWLLPDRSRGPGLQSRCSIHAV